MGSFRSIRDQVLAMAGKMQSGELEAARESVGALKHCSNVLECLGVDRVIGQQYLGERHQCGIDVWCV